jgi:hypothetical protein
MKSKDSELIALFSLNFMSCLTQMSDWTYWTIYLKFILRQKCYSIMSATLLDDKNYQNYIVTYTPVAGQQQLSRWQFNGCCLTPTTKQQTITCARQLLYQSCLQQCNNRRGVFCEVHAERSQMKKKLFLSSVKFLFTVISFVFSLWRKWCIMKIVVLRVG